MSRVFVFVVSAVLALLVVEGVLRVTPLARARSANLIEAPWMRTSQFDFVPVCGYEIKPHANHDILNLGLRGKDRSREKPVGSKRLLVVGDSVAFGMGVEVDEAFPSRLEALLAKRQPRQTIEVLNGGVMSYNTVQELSWLEDRGLALQPDAVLLVAAWTDGA